MGEPFQLGRYALHAELAAGGMAVVYLARQTGAVGFGKTVAIKRLHPHLARDPYFVTMFLDEARLAARVQHPNVVPILDVVSTESELFLVLEYVRGETLSGLLRATRKAGVKIPVPIASAIIVGLLTGLHAAHEARDELGKRLDIVHRDVSPQNLIVGADGTPRVLDFGVAKAATRLQTTREGQLKGKIPYMAPEQIAGQATAKSDVYSSALVLWEALTGQRLFRGETEAQVLHLVMTAEAKPPSTINPDVPAALDAVVMKGLEREPDKRWATAREMAVAIEAAVPVASAMKVAEWVESIIGKTLAQRDAMRADIESGSHSLDSLSAPMSTPSLPAFPQVGESSASIPHAVQGVAESTASLVVGAQPVAARSRVPYIVAGVALLCVIGVAVGVGVAVTRTEQAPASRAATTDSPPPIASPTSPPSSLGAVAPSASSVVETPAQPSASASAHHHASMHAHAATSSSPSTGSNDLKSLLDTR